jgi:hypothetical protein
MREALPRERADISPPLSVYDDLRPQHYAPVSN